MDQQTEDHLPVYRVRPRFKIHTALSVDQLIEKIQAKLDAENGSCQGVVHILGGSLSLPMAQQHYWSPQLSLSFEETGTGTILRGVYGPRPTVWGMFVFFYSLIGMATLVVGIIGLSKLTLGKPSAMLWLAAILVLIFLTLYLVSYSGQKVGRKQMIILHRFLEDATGLSIEDNMNPDNLSTIE